MPDKYSFPESYSQIWDVYYIKNISQSSNIDDIFGINAPE